MLVLDDDEAIRELIHDALDEAGFSIAVASSGEEALALLESKEFPYGVLVTDVALKPGLLDGWQVAHRAREIMPEIGLIYITAAHAAEWSAQGVPNSVLIQKPFAPAQIITAVAQLMNATSGPPGGQPV